jgi:hypothetical protein
MMMKHRQQRGMTMISWLIILSAIGFTAYIMLKIIPMYISGFNSYSSLESMTKERGLTNKSLSEIRDMLWRRLDINMVSDITKNDIYVSKGKGQINIEIDYEVREKVLGNLDVVAHFNKTVSVSTANEGY